MYSIFLTVLLAAGVEAPANDPEAFGVVGGYAGYAGFDRCPPPSFCAPPFCPPFFPVLDSVSDTEEKVQKLEKKVGGLKKDLKGFEQRVGKIEQRLERVEPELQARLDTVDKKLQALQGKQQQLEDLVAAFEAKLAERIQLLAKAMDLKLMEENLKQRLENLKDKERAIELAGRIKELEGRFQEKLRQGRDLLEGHLRQIEEKLLQEQNKKPEDAEARLALRGLEQRMAAFQGLLKDKLDGIESRLQGTTEKATTDKLQNNFNKLKKDSKNLTKELGQLSKGFDRSQKTSGDLEKNVQKMDKRLGKIEKQLKAPAAPKKAAKTSQVPDNRALVIVALPREANLYLEGSLTRGDSRLRAFLTPELEKGITYSYNFRVEVCRNGQWERRSQQVFFRPGSEVLLTFEADLSSQVADTGTNSQ